MKTLRSYFLLLAVMLCFNAMAADKIIRMADYGIMPDFNSSSDAAPKIQSAIEKIRETVRKGDRIVLQFLPGTYHFHPQGAAVREYYISNHDQDNPKKVGICLEDFSDLTLDGDGALFIFHGNMLPVSLIRSNRCTLKNITIDFETPHIAQVEIIKNSPSDGITFRPSPEVNVKLGADSVFRHGGEGWTYTPGWGIAFEENTRRIIYKTSDVGFNLTGVSRLSDGDYLAPRWKDSRLPVGSRIAMRTGHRPTPGIFLAEDKDTRIENVNICYAEGMGVLAQVCENITLDGFRIPTSELYHCRYFTTQADATHFSGCKGLILSENGYYTGMMDDAINVHGTYLKVTKRIDRRTVEARYMHKQAWGFKWGEKGDRVQFIRSKTMEITGSENSIAAIEAVDKPEDKGVKIFRLTFTADLPTDVNADEGCGIENLTWTPQVIFRNNYVSNNRARGALFSTPQKVVVEGNTFDHVSGCAILLCGDCNGWYETGACRDVTIRRNTFINVLTSQFQFTNAIISIYPEIPDLQHQVKYFHGGRKNAVTIEDNIFDTFDMPILYAKSLDGLLYRRNTVKTNTEYPPFHWNKKRILLERVINADVQE